MQVFETWLIYLIVVAIIWLILIAFGGMNPAVRLFLALLIGAIVVLFLLGNINTYCADERFWLGLLILFAFLAPLLIGFWLLWNGGWNTMKCAVFNDDGTPVIDRTIACDEAGECYPVATEIKTKAGKTTILHY